MVRDGGRECGAKLSSRWWGAGGAMRELEGFQDLRSETRRARLREAVPASGVS